MAIACWGVASGRRAVVGRGVEMYQPVATARNPFGTSRSGEAPRGWGHGESRRRG